MKLRVVGALAIALSGGLALPGLSVAGDGAVLRISATGSDIADAGCPPRHLDHGQGRWSAGCSTGSSAFRRAAPTRRTSSPISPNAGRRSPDGKTWTFRLRKGVEVPRHAGSS